jgi:hypothetical protein
MRGSKQGNNRRHVITRLSIDWKLVDYVFEPLHIRFDFILEGCADHEGLNSHGDLPPSYVSDSVMEKDMSEERVFCNPPWEIEEHIARHFESYRRTTPTYRTSIINVCRSSSGVKSCKQPQ